MRARELIEVLEALPDAAVMLARDAESYGYRFLHEVTLQRLSKSEIKDPCRDKMSPRNVIVLWPVD